MKIFKTKYRIIKDTYAGYEVQIKKWYWPFWYQANFTNTHSTLEKARKYIEILKKITVYETQ